MIAALYVATGGAYFDLPGVDPWDEKRDARAYAGPHPVVAHPPCERWGRFWHGGPNSERFPRECRVKGDDAGCFAAALAAVRKWGGVLEHPADSHAWRAFGLPPPGPAGWSRDVWGGWCCRVEQGHYGHRARKATWLYYVGEAPPPRLTWGASGARVRVAGDGFHTAAERVAAKARGHVPCERLSTRERSATPIPFRDLLISMATAADRRETPRAPEQRVPADACTIAQGDRVQAGGRGRDAAGSGKRNSDPGNPSQCAVPLERAATLEWATARDPRGGVSPARDAAALGVAVEARDVPNGMVFCASMPSTKSSAKE